MQNRAIQVTGLQKSYKEIHVLKGVDFEVGKGSIFAMLGTNGAGKTTIVRILTTLLKQVSGTATVNGFNVAAMPDNVRQSISLTGQFAAVDEILTGRENAILIAELRHLKNPRQIVDDLLLAALNANRRPVFLRKDRFEHRVDFLGAYSGYLT